MKLISKRLFYRKLQVKDANNEYLSWLNDQKINKYLEIRFQKQNIKNLRNYLKNISKNKNEYLFGIYIKNNKKHIGNIKIGEIDWNNKKGYLGIMIGDKNYWGKGFATESVKTIVAFSFKHLKLKKLMASCHEENIGSKKIFLKSGFRIEGRFIKDAVIARRRVNSLWLGINA